MAFNNSYFEISAEAFASLNVPLSVISILMNTFFIYCMVSPQQEAEQLKEPLKVLLGLLVGCNMSIHFCTLLFVLSDVLSLVIYDWKILFLISEMSSSVMIYTMMTSVTSCQWKNMFYFCQIVPPQHPFLIWFKRNIKVIVYSALIITSILFLFGLSVDLSYNFGILITILFTDFNYTDVESVDKLENSLQIFDSMGSINLWIEMGCFGFFFGLSVFVMLASSSATVLYLWRHMKNVEESGIFSPRLQRQIKVTITGITAQALLLFICSDGIIILEFVNDFSNIYVDWKGYIFCTFISVYSFGTSINISVSQSLFRKQILHVWQKLLQLLNFSE